MICPNCGFASSEDFPKCPQCGSHTADAGNCGNCGSPLDVEAHLYCRTCGAINPARASEESVVCDTHVENQAVGFCVVCGKAVCEECLETCGNKLLCNDPKHRTFLEKWRVLYTFEFEYEAAMLYANLEQQDIESEVFSKPNPETTDTPLRPTIVEVLVPQNKFEQAQEIAKSLGLTESDMSEGPFGEDKA